MSLPHWAESKLCLDINVDVDVYVDEEKKLNGLEEPTISSGASASRSVVAVLGPLVGELCASDVT